MKATLEQKTTTHSNLMKLTTYLAGKRWAPLITLSAILVLTGCCSIVSGTKQNVKIDSQPTGSTVTIKQLNSVTETNIWDGKTPAVVKLKRKNSYLVTISREGFQPIEMPIEYKGMNGWVWGNILFGGIIGVIVDSINGSATKLGPDNISVELVAVKASACGGSPTAYALLRSRNEKGKTMTYALPLNAVAK